MVHHARDKLLEGLVGPVSIVARDEGRDVSALVEREPEARDVVCEGRIV